MKRGRAAYQTDRKKTVALNSTTLGTREKGYESLKKSWLEKVTVLKSASKEKYKGRSGVGNQKKNAAGKEKGLLRWKEETVRTIESKRSSGIYGGICQCADCEKRGSADRWTK